MARGGRRPGAGRKLKNAHLRSIDGGAGHRPPKVIAEITPATPSVDAPAGDVLPPPSYLLDPEAVKVWNELAPFAHQARTLTKGTERAFSMLCRLVVDESILAAVDRGSSERRGILQRLNTLMLQFNVTPCGKPLFEAKAPEKPKSGVARFIR